MYLPALLRSRQRMNPFWPKLKAAWIDFKKDPNAFEERVALMLLSENVVWETDKFFEFPGDEDMSRQKRSEQRAPPYTSSVRRIAHGALAEHGRGRTCDVPALHNPGRSSRTRRAASAGRFGAPWRRDCVCVAGTYSDLRSYGMAQ